MSFKESAPNKDCYQKSVFPFSKFWSFSYISCDTSDNQTNHATNKCDNGSTATDITDGISQIFQFDLQWSWLWLSLHVSFLDSKLGIVTNTADQSSTISIHDLSSRNQEWGLLFATLPLDVFLHQIWFTCKSGLVNKEFVYQKLKMRILQNF